MSETRRDLIMQAAVRLIGERGYGVTGIDEIGEAAGVTGPAIYYYFDSKEAILVAAIKEAGDRMKASLEAALAPGGGPAERLRRMVASYVDAAIENRALIAIWLYESRNLGASDVRSLIRRQRDYISPWVQTLCEHHPDLAAAEAETTVHATLNLVNTVVHHQSKLAPDDLRALLTGAADRVLAV